MHKPITAVFVIFVFAIAIAAQSGRKSKSFPSQTPASEKQVTRGDEKSDSWDDYSESAPSAPHSAWAKPRSKNRSKDNDKAEKAAAPAPSAAPAAAGEEDVVKVDTAVVTVPVSVYDRNGLYISNLRRSDFKIFENGEEQEIAFFGTSDNPFTVVLLIDVSPSTSYKIEEIQQAAMAFVDKLKPADNVMVIEFDSNVSVLTELTNDRQKIYKAIQRTGFGGGTSLYEAVEFSLRKRLDKIEGRKAVVLFTDGVDTSSRGATFESTLGIAEESDSLVFPIYYNTFLANMGIGTGGVMSTPPTLGIPRSQQPPGSRSEDYTRGRAYLTELAALTGGKVFRAESTPGGLNAAFEAIAEELSRQYSVGYFPTSEGEPGERKQIKVRVNRANLIVRSRDSYIVGANEKAPNSK